MLVNINDYQLIIDIILKLNSCLC